MSKYAVLILPFFIVSLIVVEPLISKSSTDSITGNSEVSPINNQIQTAELLAQNYPAMTVSSEQDPETQKPRVIKILITAYSSSPEETDSTPLITASGNYVRPGVVAANFLPFGTRVRMPKIFGDKIFVVEDRLHERYNDRIDVWFSTKEGALKFGQQISEIEIL